MTITVKVINQEGKLRRKMIFSAWFLWYLKFYYLITYLNIYIFSIFSLYFCIILILYSFLSSLLQNVKQNNILSNKIFTHITFFNIYKQSWTKHISGFCYGAINQNLNFLTLQLSDECKTFASHFFNYIYSTI